VTDSNRSADGSKGGDLRVRTAPARGAEQPQARPAPSANSRATSPDRPPNTVARAPLAGAAPRQAIANGQSTAGTSATAQPAQPRASVSQSKPVPGAGEPYPPLSDRASNGMGAAPTAAKRAEAKRVAPRSPREAIEPDRVELPASRSTRARHPVIIAGNAVISLFLLLAVAAAYALYVGKQRFEAPGPLAKDRIVNVPRGSGIRDVSDLLMRDGVINQPWVFIGGALLLKPREGLKAGEYEFKAHESMSDVVATLTEGKVVMHQITIPEGLTSEQIVDRLMANDVLTGNIDEVPPEGSMLPDTYSFPRGTTREQIIRRMQNAQQRLVKEIWARRAPDLPLKTPQQLVILASMIEKETGKADERSRIAAVFVNRLKQKMRLQSDPTIIYGLVGGKGSLGGPITKTEIDEPTPYNTYQIDGLPPGPITNPGRASLEAAANPARTRDLYFVADGTGGHVFSETYQQQEKNVERLRKLEASQKATATDGKVVSSAPAADPPPHPRVSARRKYRRRVRAARH
jgi:UPF0755 protein